MHQGFDGQGLWRQRQRALNGGPSLLSRRSLLARSLSSRLSPKAKPLSSASVRRFSRPLGAKAVPCPSARPAPRIDGVCPLIDPRMISQLNSVDPRALCGIISIRSSSSRSIERTHRMLSRPYLSTPPIQQHPRHHGQGQGGGCLEQRCQRWHGGGEYGAAGPRYVFGMTGIEMHPSAPSTDDWSERTMCV